MKWVWDESQSKAINLDHVAYFLIKPSVTSQWGVYVCQQIGNSPTFLRTFPTYEAAQEFVGNLTGAVGANHDRTQP